MKKSELKQLIREELLLFLSEDASFAREIERTWSQLRPTIFKELKAKGYTGMVELDKYMHRIIVAEKEGNRKEYGKAAEDFADEIHFLRRTFFSDSSRPEARRFFKVTEKLLDLIMV